MNNDPRGAATTHPSPFQMCVLFRRAKHAQAQILAQVPPPFGDLKAAAAAAHAFTAPALGHAAAPFVTPFKVCPCCGTDWTFEQWRALPHVGNMYTPEDDTGPEETLELRNCTCRSTIAVNVLDAITEEVMRRVGPVDQIAEDPQIEETKRVALALIKAFSP